MIIPRKENFQRRIFTHLLHTCMHFDLVTWFMRTHHNLRDIYHRVSCLIGSSTSLQIVRIPGTLVPLLKKFMRKICIAWFDTRSTSYLPYNIIRLSIRNQKPIHLPKPPGPTQKPVDPTPVTVGGGSLS